MAAKTNHCDICIIGTGAIGKAAALGFSQAGYQVCLVGSRAAAAATSDWDLRVYALNRLAFDVLTRLKVWGALDAARIAPVSAMVVRDQSGATHGRLGFDAYGACADELAWIVEDRNLNQALDRALQFANKLTHLHGNARGLRMLDAGMQVHLDDGTEIEASLVIGADGAQSWVRGQAGIALDYRAYGQQGVVANFACERPHHGVARQWFAGEQGIVALLPLPGQHVSLVWSAPNSLAQQLLNEPASALAQRLASYAGDELGALTALPPQRAAAFPLTLQRPHTPVAPRIALIGDAAHVVHPLAGHGMNLGFGDLDCLLEVMRTKEPHRDCGDARLLARYRRARAEQVHLMQLTTDGLARLFGSELAPLKLARSFGLNLLDRLPVLKNSLIAHALGK